MEETRVVAEPDPVMDNGPLLEAVEIPLPAAFTKVLCCACRCDYCDFPNCFGCKSLCTFLCFDCSSIFCKPSPIPEVWCILGSGSSELVYPQTCLTDYCQMCCFEFICQLPSLGEKMVSIENGLVPMNNFRDGGLAGKSTFCSGMCCTMTTCDCDFPACLKIYEKGSILCIESEAIACKPLCCTEKKKENTCCILSKFNSVLKMPTTCIKVVSSVCCLETRCALPCDDEVPCIYSMLPFCTCCVCFKCKCTCCATVDELVDKKELPPPKPPVQSAPRPPINQQPASLPVAAAAYPSENIVYAEAVPPAATPEPSAPMKKEE